jgi:hypothetical protein
MVISFPREIPDVGYTVCDLRLVSGVKSSRSRNGVVNHSQVHDPFWVVDLETKPLRMTVKDEVEAWILSLRGGTKRVLFRNPHRSYPKNHVSDAAPALDDGEIATVTSGNILGVDNVASGLSLVAGDPLSLVNAHYHFCRVSEVSGTGTSRAITVEPPPPDDIGVGAAVVFSSPAMLTRLVPDSFSVSGVGLYTCRFSLQESR